VTALQADNHVVSFAVADTAANIALAIDALNSDDKLSSVSLVGSGEPPMPALFTSGAYGIAANSSAPNIASIEYWYAWNGFPKYDANYQFSPDGASIAFGSGATNLGFLIPSSSQEIFSKSLKTGAINLISTTASGDALSGNNFRAAYSPDGVDVAFAHVGGSLANGIYVKNLVTGELNCVSTAASANPVGFSNPSYSPDGNWLAWEGYPSDGSQSYVYFRNMTTGVVSAFSWAGDTFDPTWSPDSKHLYASGISLSGNDSAVQLLRFDVTSRSISVVSTNSAGTIDPGGDDPTVSYGTTTSYNPVFTSDGTAVIFDSSTPTLVANDTNVARDIFRKDLATGAVTLLSTNAAGQEGNSASQNLNLSPDNTWLLFDSKATNLTSDTTSGFWNVYLKNLVSGQVYLVSQGMSGASFGAKFSPDGSTITFLNAPGSTPQADPLLMNTNNELYTVDFNKVIAGGADPDTLYITYQQLRTDASVLGKLAGNYKLVVSDVSVTGAATVQANTHVTAFSLKDSSTDVAATLDALNANSKLSIVTLTDGNSLSITWAQYGADNSIISKLPMGSLSVSGVPVSAAAGLQADSHVGSFGLLDSSANIATNLNALNDDTKISGVTLTDSNPLSITWAQYGEDASIISKLPAGSLSVSGTPVLGAATLQADSEVSSFLVTDTASNVAAHFDELNGDSKWIGIGSWDKGTLSLSYQQLQSDASALGKLPADYQLSVNGVAVDAAPAVQANAHVVSYVVTDKASNIAANFDALNAEGKISGVTLADNNLIVITQAQYDADKFILSKSPAGLVSILNSTPYQSNVFRLTSGSDDTSALADGTIVTGNGQTLNASDHLVGGGHDQLALYGEATSPPPEVSAPYGWGSGGFFDLTALAAFTGFDKVVLNGSGYDLTLTGQDIAVDASSATGPGHIKLGSGVSDVSLGSAGAWLEFSSGLATVHGDGVGGSNFSFSTGSADVTLSNLQYGTFNFSSGAVNVDIANLSPVYTSQFYLGSGEAHVTIRGLVPYYDITDFSLASGTYDIDVSGFVGGSSSFQSFSIADLHGGDILAGNSNNPASIINLNAQNVLNLFGTDGTYDLTGVSLSGIQDLHLYSGVKISGDVGISSFGSVTGTGGTITFAGAVADLSTVHVAAGTQIVSTNNTGTTFEVGDAQTALDVLGGVGQDTVDAHTLTLTDAQKLAIFAQGSIETIIDATGTYIGPDPVTIAINQAAGINTAMDTFVGFKSGTDHFDLDHTVFSGLGTDANGQLAASAFAVGTPTGTAPQVVFDSNTGALYYDSNGAAGGATQFATLTAPHGSPDHTNFHIV
jgi:hypothetical protein